MKDGANSCKHTNIQSGDLIVAILVCPAERTDDQIIELLRLLFHQQEIVLSLEKMIHDLQKARGDSNILLLLGRFTASAILYIFYYVHICIDKRAGFFK